MNHFWANTYDFHDFAVPVVLQIFWVHFEKIANKIEKTPPENHQFEWEDFWGGGLQSFTSPLLPSWFNLAEGRGNLSFFTKQTPNLGYSRSKEP